MYTLRRTCILLKWTVQCFNYWEIYYNFGMFSQIPGSTSTSKGAETDNVAFAQLRARPVWSSPVVTASYIPDLIAMWKLT